ncbi:MAG: hypothetical protein ACI97A_004166 [Planctomycetota bacterium]|jgi:hypothetical protein
MSQEPAMEPSADAEEAKKQNVAPANAYVAPQEADVDEVDDIASSLSEDNTSLKETESPDISAMDESSEGRSELPTDHSNDLGEATQGEEAPTENSADGDIDEPDDDVSETIKLIRKARTTTVADMNACDDAGKLIRELTRAVKQTKEELAPLKTRLTSAKKEFQEAESNRLKPLVDAEKLVKSSIESFLTEESARQRHQRELQELSRQENIAEREEKIQTLESEGKVDEARILANEYPPELPPAKPIPVPQMIKAKATRRAEVNDIQALIRYVANHPEHSNLLRAATPALNAMARSTPEKSSLPGVEFLTEQKVTSK